LPVAHHETPLSFRAGGANVLRMTQTPLATPILYYTPPSIFQQVSRHQGIHLP